MLTRFFGQTEALQPDSRAINYLDLIRVTQISGSDSSDSDKTT